jgi:hypothetical protein
MKVARGEYAMVVDDDNHIRAQWIADSIRALDRVAELGIVGCNVNAVWPKGPPARVEEVGAFLAIGEQCTSRTALCAEPKVLESETVWGAGSTLRVAAWREILKRGFEFQLRGRVAGRPVGGEDTEICCALRMAGWKCGLANVVGLDHLMAPERATIGYWDRTATCAGVASSVLSLYAMNRAALTRRCGRFSRLFLAFDVFGSLTMYTGQALHPRRRGVLRRLRRRYCLGRASAYLFGYAQLRENARNVLEFQTALERAHAKDR